MDVSETTVKTGTEISFDGSKSTDKDGTITNYSWDFGDGTQKDGSEAVSVTHSYDSAGEYNVTLTVTDDGDPTKRATTTTTVTVEQSTEKITDQVEGELDGWWDSTELIWEPDSDAPEQVTFELEGPDGTDFDLFAARGTHASPWYHDKESASKNSSEKVVFEEVDAEERIAVMIDSFSGSGTYTLTSIEQTE